MLNLHRDKKIVRREPGRDGKILCDHRQDGNDEVHRLKVRLKKKKKKKKVSTCGCWIITKLARFNPFFCFCLNDMCYQPKTHWRTFKFLDFGVNGKSKTCGSHW